MKTSHIIIIVVVVVLFMFIAVVGALVALLLPAINTARMAAQRLQAASNVHEISRAINFYESQEGHFPPPYTVDEAGKPLHSWRVLLLPYLGQAELYKQIRLDEPWDSEWNRQFHNTNISSFGNPQQQLPPGMTPWAVVTGENTMFPPGSEGLSIDECPDGREHTVAIVQRSPVCWMDPAGDVTYEDAIKGFNVSQNGLVSGKRGLAIFATCDGATHTVFDTVEPRTLELLFQRNDGERVPFGWNDR